ncbi:MAG: histidine kinase dimerization/phospho-acceptor domain-containing protein, partial [Flavobacteriaceae bacterium]|nr:histidine kinase dimerization/phospho-acceptor domain-containing protein [Flavobacteriaceae bacterium]
MDGKSPRTYGVIKLDVEIFDKKDGLRTKTLKINDKWKHTSPLVARTLECVCTKILQGHVNYVLLLENTLNKIIELLESEFGNITAIDTVEGKPKLFYVALGEKIPGTISAGKYAQSQEGKSGDGIFGHSINVDKIIISNNISVDPRAKKKDLSDGPTVESFMAIPLHYQETTIGLLVVANNKHAYTLNSIKKVSPLVNVCSYLLIKALDSRETLSSKIEKLSDADKTKDRFLATMSHELRTPLHGILGMITLLPDVGPLNKKQKEYIVNITECAVELASLLNNILDFSNMSSNRFTLRKHPVKIETVVRDAAKIMEGNILAKGIDLR